MQDAVLRRFHRTCSMHPPPPSPDVGSDTHKELLQLLVPDAGQSHTSSYLSYFKVRDRETGRQRNDRGVTLAPLCHEVR